MRQKKLQNSRNKIEPLVIINWFKKRKTMGSRWFLKNDEINRNGHRIYLDLRINMV